MNAVQVIHYSENHDWKRIIIETWGGAENIYCTIGRRRPGDCRGAPFAAVRAVIRRQGAWERGRPWLERLLPHRGEQTQWGAWLPATISMAAGRLPSACPYGGRDLRRHLERAGWFYMKVLVSVAAPFWSADLSSFVVTGQSGAAMRARKRTLLAVAMA